MKKIILMTIMISTILISCGGSGGSASAVNEEPGGSSITNGTGATGTYKFSSTNLGSKEVYAVFSNENFSSTTNISPSIVGESKSIYSNKNILKTSNEEVKRIDVDSKFNKKFNFGSKDSGAKQSKNSTISKSYSVGNSTSFYVTRTGNASGASDIDTSITATLKVQNTGTRTINIWVDNTYTISNSDLQDLANAFYSSSNSNNIYTNITNIYGSEWADTGYGDLIPYSGNIDILLTNLNTNYPGSGYVMGYFSSGDTFITSENSRSNLKNMFYLDAKLFSKGVSSMTETAKTYYKTELYSTLAHEFTHMIMWYQKTVKGGGVYPDAWLNEMLAMISEDLMDDKIKVNGVSGLVEGSKSRLDEYIESHNNDEFNDKIGGYDLNDYAVGATLGLYLTRTYGTSNLAFLRNIMTSKLTGYNAVESATGDSMVAILENFGKAILLSSDSTLNLSKVTLNKSGSVSYNGSTFTLEPINVYSYGTFNYAKTSVMGGANLYKKLKASTDTTNNWSISVPTNNMPFQLVVKDSSGKYDAALSSELNNSIKKQ